MRCGSEVLKGKGVINMKTDQLSTTRYYNHHPNTLLREPGMGYLRELTLLEQFHSFYYLSQVALSSQLGTPMVQVLPSRPLQQPPPQGTS